MIRTQTWSPDTCTNRDHATACVVVQSYDDSIPADSRILSFVRFLRSCPFHSAIIDEQARFTAVRDENIRKNEVIRLLCDELGDNALDAEWDIDLATRHLRVTELSGLTALQRTRLRAALTTRFGSLVTLRARS